MSGNMEDANDAPDFAICRFAVSAINHGEGVILVLASCGNWDCRYGDNSNYRRQG